MVLLRHCSDLDMTSMKVVFTFTATMPRLYSSTRVAVDQALSLFLATNLSVGLYKKWCSIVVDKCFSSCLTSADAHLRVT